MARGVHRALAAGGSALALLLAAGCGEDDSQARPVVPLGKQVGGSVAPLAQCSDWQGGARERKLATVEDIRSQVNRTDTGIETPALSDEEAVALFDRACAATYSKGFRLYVLYARAAGFGPLLRDPEPTLGRSLGRD